MRDMWRVLITDDHAITRHGIRLLAQSLDGVEILGEAENGAEAIRLCRELRPNLVLMDLDMPEMDGVTAIRKLKEEMPDVVVLVLTVHDDENAILEALQAGASGYLPKSAGLEEIQNALETMSVGGVFMTPAATRKAVLGLFHRADDARKVAVAVETLTTRERDVLVLLVEGMSARTIASRLGISERTVNAHVGNIYRRMGVNNRVDAVREAIRRGIVHVPT